MEFLGDKVLIAGALLRLRLAVSIEFGRVGGGLYMRLTSCDKGPVFALHFAGCLRVPE